MSIIVPMKTTKIDRTKLMTVGNYAKKFNVIRQTVYNQIKSGELKSDNIDGVAFVVID